MSTVTTTPTTSSIVIFLQDAASYPEHPSRVDTIETHISWVFLTDHFAYKLKKPVQLEFLDFSTSHARRLACAEEIRLNRRLSHNVYIAMLPITWDECGGLGLDDRGKEVDFVVKMRRLPCNRALDHLVQHQELHVADIDAITEYLVDLYTCLPPMVLQPKDHFQQLDNHCHANFTHLLGFQGGTHERLVRRIHGAQKRFLTIEREMFYDRVRDGRIVEGHGDLRAEHIYLESTPAIIDCIEFSKELRQVDVLDELSFLAMDCQRLGNDGVGEHVLRAYRQASGDHSSAELAAFYKSYRACVRAKVAALRAEQVGDNERKPLLRQFHQYLNWADYYAARLGPPTLVVIGGLMGSGKSTLATQVAEALGAELVSTDHIRLMLFGRSASPAAYGAEIYEGDLRLRVYEELLAHAEGILDDGRSAVLDGTYLTNALRDAAFERGRRHGAHVLFVECTCSRVTTLARIAERATSGSSESEATPELYDQQLTQREAFDSAMPRVGVDSSAPLHEGLRAVFSAIRADLFAT